MAEKIRDASQGLSQGRESFFCTIDSEGRLKTHTRGLSILTGIPEEDLIGREFLDLFPPDERPAVRDAVSTLEGTGPRELRTRLRGPEGSARGTIRLEPLLGPDTEGFVLSGSLDPYTRELEADLAVRARQQEAVARLGELGLHGTSLENLFREAVALLAEVLEVEYAKILEDRPEEGTALLRAGTGWEEGLVGKVTVPTGQDSQAGYTLMTDQPVIVTDMESETRFSGPKLLRDHGVVSGMSVVIRGSEGPYGVLGAHTRAHRRFTQDDVNFLQSVASFLGAVIQRNHTEAQLRRSEDTFREAFSKAPMGMVLADLTGRVQHANDAFCQLVGREEQELIQTGFNL
ncbi:MAG TPA: GAF domain-containing protein, partial [Gammaproteobacteria bacterium]|nr:GAF domain-containing protein [Gammaproteobacteria bacterium]